MKRILENEIYRLIKRTPTEEELNSAIEYLDSCADDLTDYSDIPTLLKDWLHDKMAKCEYCGTWALKSEMVHNMYGYFCDDTCEEEDHQERKETFEEEFSNFIYRD